MIQPNLQFRLGTDPAFFMEYLEHVLEQLRCSLPSGVSHTMVMRRCRWVITELITNAHKHSGQQEVSLSILIFPDRLSIIKEDRGSPMSLPVEDGFICWPLTAQQCGREINIREDDFQALIASIDMNGKVTFSVKAKEEKGYAGRRQISRNFGLTIISGVCEQFTYHFDTMTGKNVFTSVIRYGPA